MSLRADLPVCQVQAFRIACVGCSLDKVPSSLDVAAGSVIAKHAELGECCASRFLKMLNPVIQFHKVK